MIPTLQLPRILIPIVLLALALGGMNHSANAQISDAQMQMAARAIAVEMGLNSSNVSYNDTGYGPGNTGAGNGQFDFDDVNGDGKLQPTENSEEILITFPDDSSALNSVYMAASDYPELANAMGAYITQMFIRSAGGAENMTNEDAVVLGKYAAAIITGAQLENAEIIALFNIMSGLLPRTDVVKQIDPTRQALAATMVDSAYESLDLFANGFALESLRLYPVFNYSAPPSASFNPGTTSNAQEALEKDPALDPDDDEGGRRPRPTPPDTGQVTPATNV